MRERLRLLGLGTMKTIPKSFESFPNTTVYTGSSMKTEDALSDILKRWHEYTSRYRHNKGYPSVSASCADWRSDESRDDEHGVIDERIERDQMEAVDFEVNQIPEPGRTSIYVNAKALAKGSTVFSHPQLPADQIKCLQIISGAREELSRRLRSRGVLG